MGVITTSTILFVLKEVVRPWFGLRILSTGIAFGEDLVDR